MSKIYTPEEAVQLIKNGDTVAFGGFVGCMHPEAMSSAIEESFLKQKTPKDLTVVFAAGQGDGKHKGMNHVGFEGLVKRAIGGHWSWCPKLQKLVNDNLIEGYNLPQGVISHLFRDIAAGKVGTITHVGLKTFVDPRLSGGKLNALTQEDLVKLINLEGKELLLYKAFPIDVVIVRATYADENGNASFEKEALYLEAISMCQAAKNSGGKVILQVEKIVSNHSLRLCNVKIPGIYVDAIVVSPPEKHMQTYAEQYNPSYSGEIRIPLDNLPTLEMDERKVIARRAAMELIPNANINLGIGMPEGVAKIASEEGFAEALQLSVESGPIGGIPASGLSFGAAFNPDCIIDSSYQFDFYDGGGLDLSFLGLAQCDTKGNINVSKFGPKIPGCGGFINISQNAKKMVFCGTFTAGGLKLSIENNALKIIAEGRNKKFVKDVEQVTFSGDYANETKQPVLYITERAVFELKEKGLELIEIAPGIDLNKDILDQMAFAPIISKELKIMDASIFSDEKMNLKKKMKKTEK